MLVWRRSSRALVLRRRAVLGRGLPLGTADVRGRHSDPLDVRSTPTCDNHRCHQTSPSVLWGRTTLVSPLSGNICSSRPGSWCVPAACSRSRACLLWGAGSTPVELPVTLAGALVGLPLALSRCRAHHRQKPTQRSVLLPPWAGGPAVSRAPTLPWAGPTEASKGQGTCPGSPSGVDEPKLGIHAPGGRLRLGGSRVHCPRRGGESHAPRAASGTSCLLQWKGLE